MNKSSLKLTILFVMIGLFGMGMGKCKSIEIPQQGGTTLTTLATPVQPNHNESPTATAEKTSGAEVLSSTTVTAPANAHKLIMIYQAMLEGETEPCG